MRKIFSIIAAVLFAGSMFAGSYVKVAEAPEDWTGDYLIVYETGNVAFNGALESLDAVSNTVDVTIAEGAIAATEELNAAKFTIAEMEGGYSVQAASGKYIAQTSYANGLKSLDEAKAHDLSIDKDGNAVLAIAIDETNSVTLRFNKASNQSRFRYYKTGQEAIQLYKYSDADVPVEAKEEFYLTGSFREWEKTADAAYKFAATATEGEYALEVAFEKAVEVKAIGLKEGEDTKWYPGGTDNNLNLEAGEYTIRLRPAGDGGEGWHEGVLLAEKKEAPVVLQYEVAEAIEAGLEENTEILVRGIITKMEFKGKNFAKYGSVNIYVADVNGAEGEFEFYNCYSLNADTFRTSTPAYDATSNAFAEFEEVADENGNAIHVGDTVIAFGKYKLYNTTHELNTGCYLTEIKHVAEAPVEEEWANIIFTEVVVADALAEEASFAAEGSEFALTIHDAANKMAIDGNDCRFGVAEAYTMYNFRLKSGGASSSSKNYFTLNIPEAGTLRLAPRTGSNSATDRALVIAQGENELYNAVVQESQAVEVQEGEGTVKVYPYVEVAVAAGEVRVSYTGGMNFYAFAFQASGEVPPTPTLSYYVAGNMTEWKVDEAYKLIPNPANEGEYMGEFTFADGAEFKVVSSADGAEIIDWFPGGTDNNYNISEAGDYSVYFRPEGGVEGWHEGYIYAVKKEALPDPTNCAEAAEAALSVSANNELYNDGKVYTIEGYVTGIKTAYSDQYHNISFWMADAADGGEVLQAFRAVCEKEADAPKVGDKVAVTGQLTKYYDTPEFAAGCTFEILEPTAVENAEAEVKAIKRIENGVLVIEKAGVRYNAFGQIMQ